MKPDAVAAHPSDAHVPAPTRLGDILTLAKLRLNTLVVATTAGGYYMASRTAVEPVTMVLTCLGTALVASGASAINQVDERDTDQLMARTKHRPVAEGRMSAREGRLVAAAFSGVGLLVLWLAANGTAALLALATLAIYALIYTPLKRRTSFSTVIGAVPGALPPLVGWAGAGGSLAVIEPWALFFIMFVWQLPHFLAIAWIYRDDYARAGLPMLPVIDRRGALTGRQAALWAGTLIPFSVLPSALHLTGNTYAIGALVLGVTQLAVAIRFALSRTDANARLLFYASITYLPLLWLLMCAGRA
jgi:protoheme IX farnesyltransferase